jgi:predicted signal transduction protein with EAL and GGDEF domain
MRTVRHKLDWLGVLLQVLVPMLIGAVCALRMVGYWR